MANFDALFHLTISSNINILFLKRANMSHTSHQNKERLVQKIFGMHNKTKKKNKNVCGKFSYFLGAKMFNTWGENVIFASE